MEVDVVLYMKEPPDEALLTRMAAGLDGPVEDLVRKDSQFSKLELVEADYVGDPKAVVELLARRKALLQRPVL
ncbi:MAG: arsenate reductase (glutaredoxin), partial [Actinobacteria bacterium]|nr:arsenate reductase (glutaredoxin) [Actinomycetota bacterium]